jgi:hypothetical protein
MTNNLPTGIPVSIYPMPIIRDWPTIDIKAIPQSERRHIQNLQMLIHRLAGHAHDFVAAIELHNESIAYAIRTAITRGSRESWGGNWMNIAARDGAITIYNFGQTIEAIRSNMRDCPTIMPLIDSRALRTASTLMRKAFPGYEQIRHSVGHAAEFSQSADLMKKHSVAGPYEIMPGPPIGQASTRVNIRNSLRGKTFTMTHGGKLYSYNLDRDSLEKLNRIKDVVYSAFRDVETKTPRP